VFMRGAAGGIANNAFHRLLPWAAKADLLRYCLIYEHGGVYLDLKSSAGDLDTLIRPEDRMVVSTWEQAWTDGGALRKSYGELQQWWLAAEPKHPALLKVIRAVVAEVDRLHRLRKCAADDRQVAVLQLTGPLRFTHVLHEHMRRHNGDVRLVCSNGNGVLTYSSSPGHVMGGSYQGPGPLLRCD
jgi:inositol phosphorylceramide mannosyltransferase catalytic subunit